MKLFVTAIANVVKAIDERINAKIGDAAIKANDRLGEDGFASRRDMVQVLKEIGYINDRLNELQGLASAIKSATGARKRVAELEAEIKSLSKVVREQQTAIEQLKTLSRATSRQIEAFNEVVSNADYCDGIKVEGGVIYVFTSEYGVPCEYTIYPDGRVDSYNPERDM